MLTSKYPFLYIITFEMLSS